MNKVKLGRFRTQSKSTSAVTRAYGTDMVNKKFETQLCLQSVPLKGIIHVDLK